MVGLINMNKISILGQVYTPIQIVEKMFNLSTNEGSILEPSAGKGIFIDYIKSISNRNIISIELDEDNYKEDFLIMDFFDYIDIKFDTIIGNPPYVKFKNINESTIESINKIEYFKDYDKRTNLYIFFIRKCIEHLNENGELIFITPREFINSTSSRLLNEFMYENGTITHWFEYGDDVVFKGFNPTVAIWRFVKNDKSRKTIVNEGIKDFKINNGNIYFSNEIFDVKFNDIFYVKVGGVSGKDSIFENEHGNLNFVCSYTKKTNKLKTMFYNDRNEYLKKYKSELINRKIKKFNENNWWMWGRNFYESEKNRIYVNCKTRDMKPFFTHTCKNYDGSILAIFPKFDIDLNKAIEMLNSINWDELGFKIGGRLAFSQRSLENTLLPDSFKIFLK